ncbi:hypothetical protein [Pseudonocardia cypriaca]|uniref:Phage integrase family protein n=1 Tax=Pseudonocardia cypriaca TaxID=882449 RepID=A0A543GCV8_9PSEU|nr:hypothetical protein [Pseudonocardia cypriaca]TQM43919.1 hypothetical protein FB388_1277 [Pseudonocardia cypriaca]
MAPRRVVALLDRLDGPDAAARARHLDASADDWRTGSVRRTPRDSYKADWRRWEDYTACAGIPMLSGGRGALVGFVVWLEHGGPAPGSMGHWPGYAPATISRRVTGVVYELSNRWHVPIDPRLGRGHRRGEGLPAPAIRGRPAPGPRPGSPDHRPGPPRHVRACPDTLEGLRDRAALTVGFYLAARASDLAWLKAGDIVDEPKGLVITVREGKTTRQSALETRAHPLLCPRENWLRWREAADLQDGAALRRVRGNKILAQADEILNPRVGPAGLSPDGVIRLLRRAGKRAELPDRVTGAPAAPRVRHRRLRRRERLDTPADRPARPVGRQLPPSCGPTSTRRTAGTDPAAAWTSSPPRTSPLAGEPSSRRRGRRRSTRGEGARGEQRGADQVSGPAGVASAAAVVVHDR